jgi:hypothetical protein
MLPTNFVELYLEGCKLLSDPPERLSTYQELDEIMEFIMNHADKDMILASLSSTRPHIVLPYSLRSDNRLPPDDYNERNEPVFFSSPGLDRYTSLLLDRMTDQSLLDIYQSVEVLNKWKLLRLQKVFDIGWNEYCQQYLAPLQNREQYLANFRRDMKK